jgi:hypothetical protein
MNKLLATNGKPTNLTDEQYKLVRTPEFKGWFGDWENDPQNASKVVDENGEPLVVYHGTNVPDINIFKESYDGGYWFTSKYEVAKDFADNNNLFGKSIIYSVFLNINKPYINNLKGAFLEHSKETFDTIKEVVDGIDGIILKNALDYVENPIISDIYNCFEPNQIKLADITNTTFDANNPDIRYAKGGIIKNEKELPSSILEYINYNNLHIGNDVFVKRFSLSNPFENKGKIIGYKIKKSKFYVKKENRGFNSTDIIYVVTNKGDIILSTDIVKNVNFSYDDGGDISQDIVCKNCGWHWNTANSEDFDKYVCHKCGFDNRTFYDSEPIGEHNLRGGGRTIAQTPSPKKDRIYGSKVNPKGSASSEKSASKIILSEKIIDSLKKKLSENNNDKVSLNDLKAVYRRGLGAYSSSHRPTISGGKPNSRNAWAMARVNKFLEKAAGKKVKAAYVQDDDLLKMHLGGDMSKHLAPNGKPSNLTHEQWHLVRTPEFKEWFGDWENDPKDASKVVDENGEPLVVYHGSKEDFYEFKNRLFGYKGFYFTNIKSVARTYGSKIRQFFLNSKVFTSVDMEGGSYLENDEFVDNLIDDCEIDKKNVHLLNFVDPLDPEAIKGVKPSNVFIMFNQSDIKLADGSNTTFDSANPDIRYDGGGLIYKKYYKRGGGGYTTIINGLEVTILKQYSDKTWIAQSMMGEIDIEKESLKEIKYYLENLDENFKIRYDDGGKTLENLDYQLRYPKQNKLVFLNADKLLKRHTKDNPSMDITIKENQIGNRVSDSKEYIANYLNDSRFINPRTKERGKSKVTFEPSIASLNDGKLSFVDGRHRILAAKEMGFEMVAVEVPKNQVSEFKKEFREGGEVTDCKEYIMQNKSLFANGYFFDMHKLSEINDPYGQVPKNLDFTLIAYNSGGQNNLGVIDTINPTILADELGHLCNLSKSQSYIVIQYFIDNAERLNDIKEIKTEKMVIVDRDNIVCENLSYANGGIIEDENGYLKYTIEGDELIIDNIKVYKQRLGTGKKLLKQIKDFARKNDLIVMLYAYPQDETITDDELKEFYISQGFELHPDDADGRLFTYANGGEIINPCIKEVIKIIYSIQKIKDCYIQDGKLVIVFVDELMVYGIGIINYHIGEFKECHDVIEPEAIVYDKEDYKSIYFNLKKDDATIGQFKEGGEVGYVGNEYLEEKYGKLKKKNAKFEDLPEIYIRIGLPKKVRNKYLPSRNHYLGILEDGVSVFTARYSPNSKFVFVDLYSESERSFLWTTYGSFQEQLEYYGAKIKMYLLEGNPILSGDGTYQLGGDDERLLDTNGLKVIGELNPKKIIESLIYNRLETFSGEKLKSYPKFKEGGEVENKETYAKWKSLVNMSSSELDRFYNSEEGKVAGLTSEQAKEQGIDSGRESARMILKMKDTKVSDWTPTMWKWANKQISFISRMSGVKGSLYDDKGNKTRKHIALLIWGNNPEKKNNGGEINNHKNTNNMESFKFNGLPHIDTISDNDLILIKEEVFVGDIDKPKHKGTRYVSCKVMSKGGMVDSLNLKVIKSVGANALTTGQMITRPIANLVSNGRKMVGSFKNGGEMPKEIESYFKEFAEINKKSNETTAIVNKISDKDERPMGLTSDRIRATQEYKEAKMQSDKAFQRLREFNSSEKGKAIQKYLRGFDRMEQMEIRKKYFSKGGELNPDNKEVKQYFAHDSGNAGGVLVGKRHSEGGIKATNNSTGQPIEMEGGEVVITRGAVSNPKKYSFDGKDMTTREVLSKLNVDGGGISFAEGGDVPDKMNCGCNSMKLGGDTMSTQDFINMSENEYQEIRLREGVQKEKKDHYSTLSKLNSGAITIDEAFREIAQKEMSLDSKYPFAE